MSDLRKAAEMALDDICGAKLCEINSMSSRMEMIRLMDKAIEALRQALAQPEQEPVDIHCPSCLHSFSVVPVAKREWVGLTDEEIEAIAKTPCSIVGVYFPAFARAIEAKLKEKNNE
jgi:hypothetical protein